MKPIYLFGLIIFLYGCAENTPQSDDRIDSESGSVNIYSTKDIYLAQAKADLLCGHKAYYLKLAHESNLYLVGKNEKDRVSKILYDYIPFQCDVFSAARAGNEEAIKQVNIEREEAYRRLDEAKKHQYEVHKRYSKKNGYDSYSIVNPDGSIEAHSIGADGNGCHTSVSSSSSGTYCD